MHGRIDRRTMLRGAGGAVAAAFAPAAALPWSRPPAGAIDQLDYRDVTLLERPGARPVRPDARRLARLRRRAAAEAVPGGGGHAGRTGKAGGWYDRSPDFAPPGNLTGFIPGHSFGQYVSALARGYAVSGDARAKAKVDRLIAGFAPTISPAFYKDYPLPAYTYDKLVIGLIDAHFMPAMRRRSACSAPPPTRCFPSSPAARSTGRSWRISRIPTWRSAGTRPTPSPKTSTSPPSAGPASAIAGWRAPICSTMPISTARGGAQRAPRPARL